MRSSRSLFLSLLLLAAVLAGALSGEEAPDPWAARRLASPSELNRGLLWMATVAVAPDDRSVAVWPELLEGPGRRHRVRLFDARLRPAGERSILLARPRCWGRIAAAFLGSRRFVVLWACSAGEEEGEDVFARLFDAGGAPRGEAFRVNAGTFGTQRAPRVAACGEDRFVAVWESEDEDGSGWGVLGRLFAAAGRPLTDPFQVNEGTHLHQLGPEVACDGSGRFVAVWSSGDGQGGSNEVLARRFAADGSPAGPDLPVGSRQEGHSRVPDVALTPGGGFAVVWSAAGRAFVRRFDAAGKPVAEELRLDSSGEVVPDVDHGPRVAAGPGGQLLVVWEEASADRIFGRFVDGERRLPLESEFPLDQGAGLHKVPEVGATAGRGFLASWAARADIHARQELWARHIPSPDPAGHPLTSEEVACEAERLERALERLAALSSVAPRGPRGVILSPGAGNDLEGLIHAGRPVPRGPRWNPRRVRSFTLDRRGKVSLQASEGAPDLRVEWLPAPREDGGAQGGQAAAGPPPACHSWATSRDRSLAKRIARHARPRGPATSFATAVYRGEGVDTFRIDLYPRREDGTHLGRVAAELRVLCDRGGEPVEIRAKLLDERTSLGQAGSEQAGGSFGLSWLVPKDPGATGRVEEPATLWAAGGDRELRIDLRSPGARTPAGGAAGSGIAEVCGR